MLRDCSVGAPEELFDVLRVIDGDTLWIEREGQREKLRLLSVDTEEKFMERELSPSKPSTRYGDLVTGWTQGFFTPRTPEEGPVRVGLRFPGGVEQRDVYGRLLCHVVTEEGVDFNLLLVRMGLSPTNKYGHSRLDHERFAAFQAKAMAEKRGVWNADTNKSGKKRPYARLLPWWEARGAAVHARVPRAQRRGSRPLGRGGRALEMSMKAAPGRRSRCCAASIGSSTRTTARAPSCCAAATRSGACASGSSRRRSRRWRRSIWRAPRRTSARTT